MKPYTHIPAVGDNPPTATLYYGQDARHTLKELPEDSVHMVCTSPPYWGLRDYGGEPSVWGGDPECAHEWGEPQGYTGHRGSRGQVPQTKWQSNQTYPQQSDVEAAPQRVCEKCGAWQGSLGMEPDPDLFVDHLVEVFHQVSRVLRPDGTLWVNLGDTYVSTNYFGTRHHTGTSGLDCFDHDKGYVPPYHETLASKGTSGSRKSIPEGLKAKDLVGIPWRFALAMQRAGWYLRSDIIWAKKNPMPESVQDRPTKTHEYIFLFAHPDSGGRYYYDHEAVKEPASDGGTRNRWSVWEMNTQPYSGAHFAVWPPDLARLMIKAGCPEGGTVLDTFSGSATTGMVALQESRNYVGLDLGADYLDLAKERLEGRKPAKGAPSEDDEVSILDLFGGNGE